MYETKAEHKTGLTNQRDKWLKPVESIEIGIRGIHYENTQVHHTITNISKC